MTVDKRRFAGLLVLMLAAVAVLITAGCIAEDTPAGPTIQEKNNISWYNYDIMGNPLYATVNHTFAPNDNFYAYANAESITAGAQGILQKKNAEIAAKILELANDESITGTEAELVHTVYAMLNDADTRSRLGVTPVLPAVEEIRKVSTLEELSELISSGGISSLKEAFVREIPTGDISNGSIRALNIIPAEFVLIEPDIYSNMAEDQAVLYAYLLENFQNFLVKCGYSADEAAHLAEELKKLEAELAPLCFPLNAAAIDSNYCTKANNPYTYEQFAAMPFPIAGDLKIYHDAGVTRYLVENPAWLEKLNELYTLENIDGFKAAMLYNLFMTATLFLDNDTQQQYFDYTIKTAYPAVWQYVLGLENGTIPASLGDNGAAAMRGCALSFAGTRINNDYLGMAVGKMLADTQIPPDVKEEYTVLIHEIMDTFKEHLENAEWLSASTREAALEKLSKMKIRVLYPDDWSFYSYDDVNYRDADTLYNLSVQLRKHTQATIVKEAQREPSAAVWIRSPYMYYVPQTTNAFYEPRDNSINIFYGFLSDVIGNPDITSEELLANAGITIAHEITHGFDPMGSKYDGDGTFVNWWTDSDRQNFDEKMKKIADYYSGFEARPGEYLQGDKLTGEATADLGGLTTILDIARTKDNFDYDRFFTTFGQLFYQPVLNESYSIYLADTHPPGMYRVNVDVQQFDEFYDTYNVTVGDQMYLAPENRFTVW